MIKEGQECIKASCKGTVIVFHETNPDILYCPNCGLYYNKNED